MRKVSRVSFVVQHENRFGEYYAFALRTTDSQNLWPWFQGLEQYGNTIVSINYCPTFKKAKEIADAWNKQFKENGTLDHYFS